MDRWPLRFLLDNTFRSLRHRDYCLYFLGQIVSFTGSWIQNTALMWLVFESTNDPLWPPLLLVAQVGPTLLLGTWSGTLADRIPKRRLILRTQTAFLVNACLLIALVLLGVAEPAVILGLQIVNGVIQSIDLPARLAFVPDLVPREDLVNAVSLNSLLFNCARAIGPAIAGRIFVASRWSVDGHAFPGWTPANLGAVGCFTLNAVSYGAVLLALFQISAKGERPRKSDSGSLLEGWRYVWGKPGLASILLLTGGVCVFGWGASSLFPAYTHRVLHLAETEYSLLLTSLGAGALVGALSTATFGTIERRGSFLAIGSLLVALGLTGLAIAGTLWGAVASAGFLGCGMILFLSTGQSTMQLGATDETRGRVMALWAMTLSASVPVGNLLSGLAARYIAISTVIAVAALGAGGVAMLAVGLAVTRSWKPAATPGADRPG